MRGAMAVTVALLGTTAAMASAPGQPLDCTDWVFSDAGLSCSPWVAYPCDAATDPFCSGPGQTAAFDNEGREYRIRVVLSFRIEECSGIDRLEIIRFNGTNASETVAYLDTRCTGPSGQDAFDATIPAQFLFDDKQGKFLVRVRSTCWGSCGYSAGDWVASISGFATTFEVLQTYTPPSSSFGFAVPYMPEGFQDADYFDTYTGTVTRPLDLSQAQPLSCAYPATAPSVGDYLTFADTVPNPSAGAAVYYLTAATYQGQTRAGRESTTGTLRGRDASVLPACN